MDAALPVAEGVATGLGPEVVVSPLGFFFARAPSVEDSLFSSRLGAFPPLGTAPVGAFAFVFVTRVMMFSAVSGFFRSRHVLLDSSILSLFSALYIHSYSRHLALLVFL